MISTLKGLLVELPINFQSFFFFKFFLKFALSLGVPILSKIREAEIKPSEPEQDNACEGKRKPSLSIEVFQLIWRIFLS